MPEVICLTCGHPMREGEACQRCTQPTAITAEDPISRPPSEMGDAEVSVRSIRLERNDSIQKEHHQSFGRLFIFFFIIYMIVIAAAALYLTFGR